MKTSDIESYKDHLQLFEQLNPKEIDTEIKGMSDSDIKNALVSADILSRRDGKKGIEITHKLMSAAKKKGIDTRITPTPMGESDDDLIQKRIKELEDNPEDLELYHVTTPENAEKIRKEGLIPGKGKATGQEFYSKYKATYFHRDKDVALRDASEYGELVVLKVKLPVNKETIPTIARHLHPDEDSGANAFDSMKNTLSGGPVAYSDIINPKNIEEIKSVKKSLPVPFTKFTEVMKAQIEKFIKQFKRKPTEDELKAVMLKINKDLTDELKRATGGFFKKTYADVMDQVGKEFGVNYEFDGVDENAIEALMNQKVLSDSFVGITQELTGAIGEIITDAYIEPQGINVRTINERLKEILDLADSRCYNIARTETSKVSAAARINSYRKEADSHFFKYYHAGPSDHRTTQCCENIKARTKNGVSYDEYVAIMREESKKFFPDWDVDFNAPVAHYQCRHTLIRKQ